MHSRSLAPWLPWREKSEPDEAETPIEGEELPSQEELAHLNERQESEHPAEKLNRLGLDITRSVL